MMSRRFYLFATGLLLPLVLSVSGVAQTATPTQALNSPAGRWKTIDDGTGKTKSIVVIREEKGKLYGMIEKVLDSDQPGPNPLCIHCEGDLKNKPENGLQIMWELKRDGNQWSGGQILDPHNGKIYRCYISLEDGGKKLKVRGFIGFALLGRTEYWLRME
jgi:uncharacterized protein (DUF2147 family)